MVVTPCFQRLLQRVAAQVRLTLTGHWVVLVVVAVMQAMLVGQAHQIRVLLAVTAQVIRLVVVVVVAVQVRLAQMQLLVVAMVEMAKQAI
jgi:hypothetical protein